MRRVLSLLICFSFLITLTGCNKNSEMDSIKKGTFNSCKDYTIEELINNYFEIPTWSIEKSDKGYNVYNINGKAYYQGKKSDVLLQLALSDNDIIVKAFEVNKMPEDKIVYSSLVSEMCNHSKSLAKKDNNVEDDKEDEELHNDLVSKSSTQNVYIVRTVSIENAKENLKYKINDNFNIEVKVSFPKGYNKNLDPDDIELYIDVSEYNGPGSAKPKVQVRQKDENLVYEVNDSVYLEIDVNR